MTNEYGTPSAELVAVTNLALNQKYFHGHFKWRVICLAVNQFICDLSYLRHISSMEIAGNTQ